MSLYGYRADRAADGALIVYDVPIFVECKRGEFDANREWLEAAVREAKVAAADQYFPPLHVRHHNDGADPVPAGFFQVTGLRQLQIKGVTKWAVFADLHVTHEEIAQDVLARRLPYRSVEIFDTDRPNFDSLALLDHEAPFHELPILMVQNPGQVRELSVAKLYRDNVANANFRSPWVDKKQPDDAGCIAMFRRGKTAFLFFEDDTSSTMTDDKNDEEFEDKPSDDGENMQDGESGLDVGAVVKAIESGDISIADFAMIEAAMMAAKGSSEPEVEEPVESMPPMESMKKPTKSGDLSELHELRGKLKALELKDAERDEKEAVKADVDEAFAKLEGRMVGNPKKIREDLTAYRVEHKSKAFNAYVGGLLKNLAVGAAPTSDPTGQNFSAQARGSKIAQKFAGFGPQAAAFANQASADWKKLRAIGSTISEEDYVTAELREKGFELAEA